MTKRRCTQTTASGHQCNAWAVHDSTPPTCSTHLGRTAGAGAPKGNQNRVTHGFYRPSLDEQELADLVEHVLNNDSEDELAVLRVLLRRIATATRLDSEVSRKELANLSPNANSLVRTIDAMIRYRKATGGDAMDVLVGAAARVLEEVAPALAEQTP
jgi:hypothetical protein